MRIPIYLDHNATTPVAPTVLEAMLPHFHRSFGNPASKTHSFGWEAEHSLAAARAQVAQTIGARTREIVFTSGATEANNLAIFGVAAGHNQPAEIITTAIEHKAVLDPCRELEKKGWVVHRVLPNSHGRVDASQVEKKLSENTALISVMAANNETGTLQPLQEIGALARSAAVPLHSDAAQAVGRVPIDVEELGVDLLSISGHKIYGPKGIGAIYVKSRPKVRLKPIQFGGGHETGLRSGTVPVPLAVGLGAAALLSEQLLSTESNRLNDLIARLWTGLNSELPDAVRHGHESKTIPGTLCVGFPGIEAEALLLGVPELAISSGSACTSAELEPSHVLRSMGVPPHLAHGSVRFGLGRSTRREEVDFAVDRIVATVRRLRG